MINDSLIGAALRFRDTELWKKLDDSMLFAVRLSSGELIYCCVMGSNGEHHALALYKGSKGLNSFYSTLKASNQSFSQIFIAKSMFDHINCDFTNASQMAFPERKADIQQYAKKNGLKIRRSNGYPDFIRFRPLHPEAPLSDPQEQAWAEEALEGAIAMAMQLSSKSVEQLGFDPKGDYPNLEGGTVVPMIANGQDGEVEICSTTLPGYVEPDYSAVEFDNTFSALKFANMEHHSDLVVRCKILPLPEVTVESDEDGFPYLLSVICREPEPQALMPLTGNQYPNDGMAVLTKFGERLLEETGFMPSVIEVTDGMTEAFFADFCRQCHIKLRRNDEEYDMEDTFLEQMFSMIMMGL